MLNLATDALTPTELSESTGFTMNTLATWRSRGRGPKFIRVMGRIYYLKTDVQEWLDAEIDSAAAA